MYFVCFGTLLRKKSNFAAALLYCKIFPHYRRDDIFLNEIIVRNMCVYAVACTCMYSVTRVNVYVCLCIFLCVHVYVYTYSLYILLIQSHLISFLCPSFCLLILLYFFVRLHPVCLLKQFPPLILEYFWFCKQYFLLYSW